VVLKKAQAEIDAVVGLDQLPDFGHFDSLPYITAITKEALRWKEVAPIGDFIFNLLRGGFTELSV